MRWIKTSEARPPLFYPVLIWAEGERVSIGCIVESGGLEDWNPHSPIDRPTHWQPLPEPPGEND